MDAGDMQYDTISVDGGGVGGVRMRAVLAPSQVHKWRVGAEFVVGDLWSHWARGTWKVARECQRHGMILLVEGDGNFRIEVGRAIALDM